MTSFIRNVLSLHSRVIPLALRIALHLGITPEIPRSNLSFAGLVGRDFVDWRGARARPGHAPCEDRVASDIDPDPGTGIRKWLKLEASRERGRGLKGRRTRVWKAGTGRALGHRAGPSERSVRRWHGGHVSWCRLIPRGRRLTEATLPASPNPSEAAKQPPRPRLRGILGPGLITGASDDDPSGIATYSQAGAQYGYQLGWTLLFSWLLMCAIQEISARIGRVTGRGISGLLKKHYPMPILYTLVSLLVVANTINLAADLGAMAAALKLLIGGPSLPYVVGFGILSAVLETFVRYSRYVSVLKWLTVSLFAYVGVTLVVHVPWLTVIHSLVLPRVSFRSDYLTVVVAILGTTISPYWFFWQAEEEVEDEKERAGARPLIRAPLQATAEFRRIRVDTYVGMGLSNAVAFFIMTTTAATLNASGVTDIQTSSQAAEARRPGAGAFVFLVFSLRIIGTGLLALPVLAGSSAYAIGEAFGWHVGLARKPARAKRFYITIAAITAAGAGLNVIALDPIKALFWSAVINGVVAVPIMVTMMRLASNPAVMDRFTLPPILRMVGWLATAVMGAAAVGMAVTLTT